MITFYCVSLLPESDYKYNRWWNIKFVYEKSFSVLQSTRIHLRVYGSGVLWCHNNHGLRKVYVKQTIKIPRGMPYTTSRDPARESVYDVCRLVHLHDLLNQ